MDHPIQQDTEEVMTQSHAQQSQPLSTRRTVPVNRLAASLSSMRTVAFSLLVDRALSA